MRYWVGALALTGVLALAASSVRPIGRWPHENAPWPGADVEGRRAPTASALQPWVESLAERVARREVYLHWPDGVRTFRFEELGVAVDAEASEVAVLEAEGKLSLRQRFAALLGFDVRREYRAVFRFDAQRAAGVLARLAPEVETEPVEARLDLGGHRRIDDLPGRQIDIAATLLALSRAPREDGEALELGLTRIAANVTSEDLADVDVSRLLSSYETDFAGKAGPRAVNIAKAAEYLDGTLVMPGEVLSFNRVVGARSLERGFTWAPEIVNDEMERGVGGGVCQVATTLHAASVLGGFDVVRRRSHSRPSGYAPLGLDATVIDGEVDLRLKNPYDRAIIVHAFLPSRTRIKVELLGHDAPERTEQNHSVIERVPFSRRVTTRPEVLEPEQRQKGIYGYEVVSHVRLVFPDGGTRSRRYRSKYYPVPEVFWVPLGYRLAELPPLPEGATHWEVNGERVEHTDEPPDVQDWVDPPPS